MAGTATSATSDNAGTGTAGEGMASDEADPVGERSGETLEVGLRGGDVREHSGPALAGALLSSLRRHNGAIEARIVNETAEPAAARFGDESIDLRPWEIRTVRLS